MVGLLLVLGTVVGAPPVTVDGAARRLDDRPRLRAGFDVTVTTGLPDADLRTRLRSTLSIGLWRELWLELDLGASVSQAVGIGPGDAQPVLITGGVSLGWEFAVGSFGVRPSVGLAAGVLVARGNTTGERETAVLPALDVVVGVTVYSPWHVHGYLGVAMPTLRARLTLEGSDEHWREPPVRILTGIGLDWGAGGR